MISCKEEGPGLAVYCSGLTRLVFDRSDGMLRSVRKGIDSLEVLGPLPNLRTRGEGVIYSYHRIREYTGWELLDFDWKAYDDSVALHVSGTFADSLPLTMEMVIFPDASMDIRYALSGIPKEYIRELGVRFVLENRLTSLAWERLGYWSEYPEDHLSAIKGTAALYPDDLKTYRSMPPREWAFDTKSFYYDGTAGEDPQSLLINRAKATKENILDYSLLRNGLKVLSVQGNGDVHCRLAKTGDTLGLFISNEMDYVDLSWGNYQRNLLPGDMFTGKVRVTLFDN
jgi:hypothetical protein